LYLWDWFMQLHGARQFQLGYGAVMECALTYPDIAAWSQLHGIELVSWEVRVLKELDMLWLSVSRKAKSNNRSATDGHNS